MQKVGKSFSEWFDGVLKEAGIYDYGRYPVKGTGVWTPYGFSLRKKVIEIIRRNLDATGHEEILLPMLIPEDLLVKEEEHIRGFRGEVYWVTRGGMEELDVKYALRPTSETSISLMESFWLSSYKQLPKKYYQIVSMFRYETKATRAMIRLREVTTFKEAHTAHSSFEDADRQVMEAIEIYRKIFDELGIPYVVSKRPDWDKFAGALYTIAFDTIMPDGKTLQIGTVHHLGQAFSKALDVKIQLPDESIDYVWQTSYGVSDRVIAALISVHGDDRGAVFPFKVAPIQVVIVPIYYDEETKQRVLDVANRIKEKLNGCGFRAHVDDREELTPGRKYYEWEIRGVPLRIEVGKREVESEELVVARRDLMKKLKINKENICEEVKRLGKEIDDHLRVRARKWMEEKIRKTEKLFRRDTDKNPGIIEVPWCGRPECGLAMQEKTELKTLGSPLKPPEWIKGKVCPVCGKPAVTVMRLAKTY